MATPTQNKQRNVANINRDLDVIMNGIKEAYANKKNSSFNSTINEFKKEQDAIAFSNNINWLITEGFIMPAKTNTGYEPTIKGLRHKGFAFEERRIQIAKNIAYVNAFSSIIMGSILPVIKYATEAISVTVTIGATIVLISSGAYVVFKSFITPSETT